MAMPFSILNVAVFADLLAVSVAERQIFRRPSSDALPLLPALLAPVASQAAAI